MEILKLMKLGLQSFAGGITQFVLDPIFIINPLMLLAIFLVASQYKGMVRIQRQMYEGRVKTRLRDLVSTSLLAGILAGLAGSMLITVLGITFLKFDGLLAIVILSLLLMFFVNPRYVCLSYAGGLLSVLSLIFFSLLSAGVLDASNGVVSMIRTKLDFDVSALMIIIAVMHLVESVLMWIDGHRGAVPIFMRRDGKLVGGFVMQRLWILPVIFFILMQSQDVIGQTVATPGWWPLFGPDMTRAELNKAVFGAMPLLAMLGYSDFSMSTPVKIKVRRSALELLGFSFILLVLALISYKIYAFKFIAAIFAPVAHEFLIMYERYRESKALPIWTLADDGVIVVDTLPESPAETIGIKSGDKVVGINNKPVRTIEDVMEILSGYINYMWIEVINLKGEKRILEFSNYQSGIDELGIITVPGSESAVVVLEDNSYSLISRLLRKLKK